MNLARRAFTVSGWTLVSRVLGLLRDALWAGSMGGSLLLDAFLTAFALPNLLRNLFGEGALSAAFVPRYVQQRDRDPEGAERFAGAVLARLGVLLAVIAFLGMVAAAVVAWLGAGRSDGGWEKATLVAVLAIPQIPYLIFICLAAIAGGVLNGRRHFWVPAAAPVVLNLVLISTVGLGDDKECRILPYAVLVAGVLQLAMHVWALKRDGGIPPLSLRATAEEADLRRAFLPVLLSSSIYQVNTFLDSIIAMAFVPGAGAVSFLYFGNRLLQFPMALIGHGVSTAAYPELSSRAAEGWPATGAGLREACRLLAYWLLPAAVGLLVTADPIVRAIYERGRFDAEAVLRTVLVVRMLALALLPISISKLLLRAFHARRDQRTPMRISLAMVALNLALNLVLVQTSLREAGLALATAVSSLVGCIVYLVVLHRRGAGQIIDFTGLLRPLAATVAMAAAVWALLAWWPATGGGVQAALHLAAAVAVGVAVYVPIAGIAWMRAKPGVVKEPPMDGDGRG